MLLPGFEVYAAMSTEHHLHDAPTTESGSSSGSPLITQGQLRLSIAVRQYHETDDLVVDHRPSGHQPTDLFVVQFGDNVGTDKSMVFDCDVAAHVYTKEFD